MIDRAHKLSLVRQCQLLDVARSTAYYRPVSPSAEELALMRRIDELHLNHPFAGARMLSKMLKREGSLLGRRRVSTLMKRMRIHAIYRKPNTSKRYQAHPVYPYLFAEFVHHSLKPCLGSRYHVHPNEARLRLSVRRDRLGKPSSAVMAII